MLTRIRSKELCFQFNFRPEEACDVDLFLFATILAMKSLDRLLESKCVVIYDTNLERQLRERLPGWVGGVDDSQESDSFLVGVRREVERRHGIGYLKELASRLANGPPTDLDEFEFIDN